jgi:hypothetical protein
VLLALAASIIVAAAEGILYAIWSDRQDKRKLLKQKRSKQKPKEESSKVLEIEEAAVDGEKSTLRRRAYEYDKEEGPAASQS